jgi:hypothetical protein
MQILRHLTVLAICCLAAGVQPIAAADIAVWVYDLPQWTENRWETRSAALPPGTQPFGSGAQPYRLGPRHVYASVEEGPRFLLDDEFQAAHLQRLAGLLREHGGIAVHAMLLQDTRWLDDPAGARDRLTRLLQLNRYRPEQAFAGVHVDVEPHSLEAWDCGGIPERRTLILKLQGLLTQLSQGMASSGKATKRRPLLSAALPWWIGPLSADIPEASSGRWLESLDEIVLMAFGDPGGPLVGGSARALLRRLENGHLWTGLPAGKGIRIGLATYEYASAADLAATIRELDRGLARQPAYRGTAIFHSGSSYGAPLAASIRGLVQDASGKPVAGAGIRAGDRQTVTNRCGRFIFRNLPLATATLEVEGIGLGSVSVPVMGLAPGSELEMPPIVVSRRP